MKLVSEKIRETYGGEHDGEEGDGRRKGRREKNLKTH